MFYKIVDGTWGWFKDGDEQTDGRYVGEISDGVPNGNGIIRWSNGEMYVGEFKDGKKDGQGTFTYPNGDKYVGEYKDGRENGQGTYTSIDGDKYIGEFKDDQLWNVKRYDINGNIIETWISGKEQQ